MERMQPWSCSIPSSISSFISDHHPLTLLTTQCTTMRDLHKLHSQLIKLGLSHSPIVASRLLSFSAASGDLHYASLVLTHTRNPNTFMYNTLIRALSRTSSPHLSLSLFLTMLHTPTHRPDRLTFPSLFSACASLGSARFGAELHAMVAKLGYSLDPYIRNSIISMYASCGCIAAAASIFADCPTFDVVACNSMVLGLAKHGLVDEARQLFDRMPERNVMTWSSMVSGYVRNWRYGDALGLFNEMIEDGIEPNANIMVSLLRACACLGALEQGEWIVSYLEKSRIERNCITDTAIIDMYCKCGSVGSALQVFDRITNRGLSSWNAMISGLAIHGRGEEALRLFERLGMSGLKPDGVSFIGVLTACNHLGLVDEAWYYFSLMVDVYGIEPAIEHYGCMVDVLGRAGRLSEAEELALGMPVEPDLVIWGSLLSACRMHGNMEIGERAAMQLAELNPRDSGGYVLLSNTYAGAGEFRDAIGTRLVLKEKGVMKVPGCSMVEVNGEAHEFVTAGVLHPQAREIFQVLDELGVMMREESCIEL